MSEFEEDALKLVARRAAGSMRDSQSLLEQILSFSSGKITTAGVHAVLGTADESRLHRIVESFIGRDASAVLEQLQQATQEGVDAGQLGEQLLSFLRDVMVAGIGGSSDLFVTAEPGSYADLRRASETWGTSTVLAAIQILDEALVRMRHSTQSRILLEVSLVQICRLQDLQSISDLIAGIQAGKVPPGVTAGASVEKKKLEDVASSPQALNANHNRGQPFAPSSQHIQHATPSQASSPTAAIPADSSLRSSNLATSTKLSSLTSSAASTASASVSVSSTGFAAPHFAPVTSPGSDVDSHVAQSDSTAPFEIWAQAIAQVGGYVADCAGLAAKVEVGFDGTWKVLFPVGSDFALMECQNAANFAQLSSALAARCGREVKLALQASNLPPTKGLLRKKEVVEAPQNSQSQLIRKYNEHPLVRSLLLSLDGQILRVDPPQATRTPSAQSEPEASAKSLP